MLYQRLQEILGILIFLKGGKNKRTGGKNASRSRNGNIRGENAYGNGNPNIYPKTLLHLLHFFEEKSMTHTFTSPALNVLKLNVTYRTL